LSAFHTSPEILIKLSCKKKTLTTPNKTYKPLCSNGDNGQPAYQQSKHNHGPETDDFVDDEIDGERKRVSKLMTQFKNKSIIFRLAWTGLRFANPEDLPT
jgi:hypothetical protein